MILIFLVFWEKMSFPLKKKTTLAWGDWKIYEENLSGSSYSCKFFSLMQSRGNDAGVKQGPKANTEMKIKHKTIWLF